MLLGSGLAGLACAVRIVMPDGTGFLIGNLIFGYFPKDQQQKAASKVIMACNLGMCLGFLFYTTGNMQQIHKL